MELFQNLRWSSMKMTLATKGRPKKNSKIDDIRTDPLTD